MSRLKELRKYVDTELNKMEDEEKRNSSIIHLYGVSLAATMIAKKRGMNWEIASMAAMDLERRITFELKKDNVII